MLVITKHVVMSLRLAKLHLVKIQKIREAITWGVF